MLASSVDRACLSMLNMSLSVSTTLVTRVGKRQYLSIFPIVHLAQVCISPFSNIERGNGGVDTYSVGFTVMI